MIIITRPIAQAQTLLELCHQHQWPCCVIPMLSIEPSKPLTLPTADLAIFISQNAVEYCIQACGKLPHCPSLAIGPSTAQALMDQGCTVLDTPATAYSTEGLLKLPTLQAVQNKKILIICGNPCKNECADVLTARGAQVICCPVYNRLGPLPSAIEALRDVEPSTLKAITFSSLTTLDYFDQTLQAHNLQHLSQYPWIVISSKMMKKYEKKAACVLAKDPTPASIIEALKPFMHSKIKTS